MENYPDLRHSTEDRSRWIVFAVAVAADDADKVRSLLEQTVDRKLLLNGSEEEEGRSVLHVAAVRNCPRTMTLLAGQEGVEVNRRDDSGRSCLHTAVELENVEVVKALIANNSVNVNLAWQGWTPLRKAIHNRSVPVARALADVAK